MMELEGKTALVTGGASGIGLACVTELLRNGANVAVCDVDVLKGTTVVSELTKQFGVNRAIFIKTDVTNASEFEDAFRTTISRFSTLDIVLNNAGVSDIHNWERTIAVNFNGVVIGTDLAFKYMGRNYGARGGILCNTASVAGLYPSSAMAVYCATKHAVVGLTRSYGLPYHMERTGVRVVAMCPGLTESTMVSDILNARASDDQTQHLTETLGAITSQKAANVATGMMVVLKTAESGSIWVCRLDKPVFEVTMPDLEAMRTSTQIKHHG